MDHKPRQEIILKIVDNKLQKMFFENNTINSDVKMIVM